MKPRIRLIHLFALTIICALLIQNLLLRREIKETKLLVPSDVIAVQVPGIWKTTDYPAYDVEDTIGIRKQVTGFPLTILEDGSVGLPKIGSIQLAGLSIDQARSAIAEAYSATGTKLNQTDVKIQSLSKRSVNLASN